MSKFVTQEFTTQRADPNTGEVLEFSQRKEVIKVESEPFFLTYSKQILALYSSNVLNATTKVLYKLLEFAEFNTGKVYMNSERVDEILEVCKISRPTYHRALNELITIGIISKNKNTYTIEENMFWKGDRRARELVKEAKMKIAFEAVIESNNNNNEDDTDFKEGWMGIES